MNETQAELLLLKITTSKGMEEWGSIILWILSSIIFLLYLDYFYLFFLIAYDWTPNNERKIF